MRPNTRFILLAGISFFAAHQAIAQGVLLDEITVSANRTTTEAAKTGSSVEVITQADLKEQGRMFLLDFLGQLPGLTFNQAGPSGTNSGFSIRGANQSYVVVRIDGIEIGDPTGTQVSANLSNLLLEDIARIEVVRGSQSALYGGEAVGGVIDITTKRPERNGLSQSVSLEVGSYATRRGGYRAALRSENADLSFSLQHLRTDGFSAADEAEGNTEADGYETTRLSLSGNYYLSDSSSIYATTFWQKAEGEFDEYSGAGGDGLGGPELYDNKTMGLRLGSKFETGSIRHDVSVSYLDVTRHLSSDTLPAIYTYDYKTTGSRTKIEYLGETDLNADTALVFGADTSRENVALDAADDQQATISGAFAQIIFAPGEQVTTTLGMRHDRHSEFGGFTTGRASIAYQVSGEGKLRASVGTGFRAPSLYELFDPFSGNSDLTPERSTSFEFGYDHATPDGRGSFSATYFDLRITDEICYAPYSCDGIVEGYTQSDGTSWRKGVELAASYALSATTTLAGGYTYTETRDRDGERISRIPRHDLSVTAATRMGDDITLAATARYVRDTVDRGEALDDYVLLNAKLSYRLNDDVDLYLRAENLTDADYQTARGYGTAGRSAYLGLEARF